MWFEKNISNNPKIYVSEIKKNYGNHIDICLVVFFVQKSNVAYVNFILDFSGRKNLRFL